MTYELIRQERISYRETHALVKHTDSLEKIQNFLTQLQTFWINQAMNGYEKSGFDDPDLYLRIKSLDPEQNLRYCSLRDTLNRKKGDCKSAALAAHAMLQGTRFNDSYLLGLYSPGLIPFNKQGHELCVFSDGFKWGSIGILEWDMIPPTFSNPEEVAHELNRRYVSNGLYSVPRMFYDLKKINRFLATYANFNLKPFLSKVTQKEL